MNRLMGAMFGILTFIFLASKYFEKSPEQLAIEQCQGMVDTLQMYGGSSASLSVVMPNGERYQCKPEIK